MATFFTADTPKRKYHREYMRTYRYVMSKEQKEAKRAYDRARRAEPGRIEIARARSRRYNQELRMECLTQYGGTPPVCACCGEGRVEFLGIDHISGGGQRHRKSITTTVYRWLKSNKFPDGFMA